MGRGTCRWIDSQREKQIVRNNVRGTDTCDENTLTVGWTDGRADRRTDRQEDKQTDRNTDRGINIHRQRRRQTSR
jgi:hypothetical protein